MLDTELREGKQHCQKNTPEYLAHNIEIIKKLNLEHPVLFRLDSGNDAASAIWWIKLWDHDPWLPVFSRLYLFQNMIL